MGGTLPDRETFTGLMLVGSAIVPSMKCLPGVVNIYVMWKESAIDLF
jgi:hypothetical protein